MDKWLLLCLFITINLFYDLINLKGKPKIKMEMGLTLTANKLKKNKKLNQKIRELPNPIKGYESSLSI